MISYAIEKPNTSYTAEEDCPMKFSNNDICINDAVERIIKNNEPFIFPNSDLLAKAVMGEKWWEDDNG